MHSPDPSTRSHFYSSGLVVLFLLALLPRITGLLGFSNVDEAISLQLGVRVLAGEIVPNTHIYSPMYNYLSAAVFVVMYAIGRVIGVWHGTADFRAQYFSDPTPFLFAMRLVSACLGAVCAPLAASIASRLGLTRRSSLMVGGIVALWPMSVWLSHVAKPDAGAAFGVLLLVWLILRKFDDPQAKAADVLVGVGLAIALSFKQTALLVVVPCFVGLMALLKWDRQLPWPQFCRGLLISSAVCVLVWIAANIGLVLDLKNFLHYQRFSATTQWREGTAHEIARVLVLMLAGNFSGITAPGLIAWLFAPCVRHDRRFLVLWGSTVFAIVGFSALSGTRLAQYRFLPYDALAITLGCIAALSLWGRKGLSRLVGLSLVVAILACSVAGSVEVVRQAAATPMPPRVAKVIKAIVQPQRDKILAANPTTLGVPSSAAADDDQYRRHEQMATRYGVKLPERAEENRSRRHDTASGYYIWHLPIVIGGMEDFDQKAMEKLVLPYSWPLQDEEWALDHWTARGFNIFVVEDEAGFLNSTVRLYRSLHQQIKERCELVALLPTTRRLFYEKEVRIYRFRDPDREQRTAPESSAAAGKPSVLPPGVPPSL